MRAYALIPARSGSKGLPDKNIMEIDGIPLLAYSVMFGKALRIDRVLLSTDSQKYADIGERFGAECPFLRSAEAASDSAGEHHILADLDARLPRHGIELPDVWVWLKPTCPFRSRDAVQQALRLLENDPSLHSVRIVTEADARIHRINEQGFLEPYFPGLWPPERSKIPRTYLPKAYSPFNLEVFRHEGWKERGALFMGTRIKPIVLPRITGLDIDDRDGAEIIKALIEARPRPEFVARHLHVDPHGGHG